MQTEKRKRKTVADFQVGDIVIRDFDRLTYIGYVYEITPDFIRVKWFSEIGYAPKNGGYFPDGLEKIA
jgi:hypothetical protein